MVLTMAPHQKAAVAWHPLVSTPKDLQCGLQRLLLLLLLLLEST